MLERAESGLLVSLSVGRTNVAEASQPSVRGKEDFTKILVYFIIKFEYKKNNRMHRRFFKNATRTNTDRTRHAQEEHRYIKM